MQRGRGDAPGQDAPGIALYQPADGIGSEPEAAGPGPGRSGSDVCVVAQAVTSGGQSGGRLAELGPALPSGMGAMLPGRVLGNSAAARHLTVLACYLAAGVAVNWPRAAYLTEGKLPASRDAGSYVWDFWWVAHQVEHLGNPWFTRSIAAPVGAQLGYHALMPLEGVLMIPVTLAFGPSASYNLLSALMPGLLCYAMYRAARLWLRSQVGAIAAGGFFGLSSMLAWHAWYQLNLAVGVLFLPLALEAAVRLRRQPGWWQAVILGVILGASLLTDQESAIMVAILVLAVLLSWLARRPTPGGAAGIPRTPGTPCWARRLAVTAVAVVVALAVASPQIAAMVAQTRSGGASVPAASVAVDYVHSGTSLPELFTASPQVISHGLTALNPVSFHGPTLDGVATFGLLLTALAAAGLAVSWRRRGARQLALLWLGAAALSLGSTLKIGGHVYVPAAEVWHGLRLSAVMPYTWFVQIPGMAGFREAARLMMLAFVPAALLAGAAVEWLRYHAAALVIPVLVLGALEVGWAGNPAEGTMPTALPALDHPIAADHSQSLVVDVPFGVRGGVPLKGEGAAFDPEAQVLATADGHPRAVGFLSRLPAPTLAGIRRHAFYDGLLTAEGQPRSSLTGTGAYPALLAAARLDARRMDVGWVLIWPCSDRQCPTSNIIRYLQRTGFRLDYKADGVLVYRPA